MPGGWVSLESRDGDDKTVLKKPDECVYECRVKVSGNRQMLRIFVTIGPGRRTKAIFIDPKEIFLRKPSDRTLRKRKKRP